MNKKPTIKIIGAGFSGLSLAYYLNEKGYAVEVYEKNTEPGGLIRSIATVDGLVETAANGFMGQSHVIEFFEKNKISLIPSSEKSKKRFIFRAGKPRRWPLGLSETLVFLFKVFSQFILTRKAQSDLKHKTIDTWGRKYLTSSVVTYLLAPALQGIYAGDVRKLSVNLILSSILNKKSKHKKVHPLVSHQQGCQALLKELAQNLTRSGVQFHYGIDVNSDWMRNEYKKSGLVLATASHQALDLIDRPGLNIDFKNEIQFLKSVSSLPVVTATAFFKKKPDEKYLGFGVLFPKKDKAVRALGVLMNTQIFQRGEALHSENWIYGGALDADILGLSDDEIKKAIQSDRKIAFLSDEPFHSLCLTRWPKALPYYDVQLEAQLEKFVQNDHLYLHGNYMGALGLSKILDRSLTLAEEIDESFKRNEKRLS